MLSSSSPKARQRLGDCYIFTRHLPGFLYPDSFRLIALMTKERLCVSDGFGLTNPPLTEDSVHHRLEDFIL